MAEKKLRFRGKIAGKEAGVVSAIIPPVDVLETFGTKGRVPVNRDHQRLSISIVADANGRLPHDAGE